MNRAVWVEDAMHGPDEALDAFLKSNELWGGPGSIADQGGGCDRNENRRKIEHVLVQIGGELVRTGPVNRRMAGWVAAFQHWEERAVDD